LGLPFQSGGPEKHRNLPNNIFGLLWGVAGKKQKNFTVKKFGNLLKNECPNDRIHNRLEGHPFFSRVMRSVPPEKK